MAVGVEGQVHRHGLKRPVFQHRGELSTRKVSVAIVNGQGVLIRFQQAIRNVVANAIRFFLPQVQPSNCWAGWTVMDKSNDRPGGTSLGLAMAGKIYAHNASRGGAAFHILMPTKQSGDTVPAPL
jgi:hypothetical protein